MKQIRGIIIDDEKWCISELTYHLSMYMPDLHLVATGSTKEELVDITHKHSFNIAFLDIQLGQDSVFDTLNNLKEVNFMPVFVTAYDQYALKAIKANAFDYLLKPLNPIEVSETAEKIRIALTEKPGSVTAEQNKIASKRIIIKEGEQVHVIDNENVLLMKAQGFYTTIYFLLNGKLKSVLLSKPMNQLEKEYPCDIFFRTHKSYIINVNKIESVKKKSVMLKNKFEIPIAKRRINEFLNFLK